MLDQRSNGRLVPAPGIVLDPGAMHLAREERRGVVTMEVERLRRLSSIREKGCLEITAKTLAASIQSPVVIDWITDGDGKLRVLVTGTPSDVTTISSGTSSLVVWREYGNGSVPSLQHPYAVEPGASVASLERATVAVDPRADRSVPVLVADLRIAGEGLHHVAAVLTRGAAALRVIAMPAHLTVEEDEALIASYPDPDATSLARAIRRAEGMRERGPRRLALSPPIEVGIFVASKHSSASRVAAGVAAAFMSGEPGTCTAQPVIIDLPITDDRYGEFMSGHLLQTPGKRFARLFGPGDLSHLLLVPSTSEASFPGVLVDQTTPVERGETRHRGPGLVLGRCTTDARSRHVVLSDDDIARHLVITGQTGTGKSRLLEHLAVQEAARGGGFLFLDPHGDSVDRVLGRMPSDRLDDVRVFDPLLEDVPALNPLEADSAVGQGFVIQDLSDMFYDIFDPGHTGIVGPRFEAWLRAGATTLLDAHANGGPPAVLTDIPRLFADRDFLKERFAFTRSEYVQNFWVHEFGRTADFHVSEMLGWFSSKFDRFASNPLMRRILHPGRNDIDLAEVMATRGIVLVKLPQGVIGSVNASMLGYVFTARLWVSTLARAGMPPESRTRFTLFADEFQTFASTTALDAMLAEARKFGLCLVLAHQYRSQLRAGIRAAIDGNVGNHVTFRVGRSDARELADLYDGSFEATELTRLPNLSAAASLLDGGELSSPFTLTIGADL